MGKVLKADASSGDAYVQFNPDAPVPESWLAFDAYFPATPLAAWLAAVADASVQLAYLEASDQLYLANNAVGPHTWQGVTDPPEGGDTPAPDADTWATFEIHYLNGVVSEFLIDGTTVWSVSPALSGDTLSYALGLITAYPATGPVYYRDVKVGTTQGASDIFSDDFSSGDLSAWSVTSGDVSVVDDPAPQPSLLSPGRRVGIAFDDGPLEPDPTWTWLDDDTVFPSSFVAGYDTHGGRETLISQTETGTATVYINDRAGLLDANNDDSPYQGKLSGRQIILQLWNPVTEVWEPQWRGWIDNYTYDIDPATDAHGEPINASIQIECVDVFDYANGVGLTPGMAGQVPPPAGMEDGVWYPPTDGTVQDRLIQIAADIGLDPSRYDFTQGNVKVVGVKYDPDESALTAFRDAADAELPFIANLYVDRYGKLQFRGRYSRFAPGRGGDPEAPLGVSDEPGSDWDFWRWPLGDGVAIRDNLDRGPRGQVRVLLYNRDRADLINAAMCWPQGLPAADMPDQVYAAPTSITDYGKHDAPPMSDLLTGQYVGSGTIDPDTGQQQCYLYAKLLVENKKTPRYSVTRLQLKAMRPDDPRAEATWGAICSADISHIVNLAVGYPGGTGFQGVSPDDDYYIEGRSLTVRPLNQQHDYVECDLEVSPAVWSMDTHGVFPEFGT